MSDNVNEELIENEKKMKKKTNKKAAILVLLIVLVIGIILLLAFSPYKLLFSTKKMNFLSYVTKDITEIKSISSKVLENKLIKIVLDGNKKIDFDFDIDMKKMSGRSFINDGFVTLKLNEINEHDLLLENKNLDTFWAKIGLADYELPSEINFLNNPFALSKKEQKKISNFTEKSVINVLENLQDSNFLENSQKNVNIDNKEISLKTIEMKLSEYDLLILQKEVLRSFKNEGILELMVNKINSLGLGANLDIKELKEALEKEIAYIDLAMAYNDLQEQDSEYFLIYRMYYDEETNVIARELTEQYTYEGQEYEDIIVRVVSNGDYYELKLFNQEENYAGAYYNIISDKVTEEGNIQYHNITYAIDGFFVEYAEDGTDYEYVPINSSINYDFTINKAEDNLTVVTLNDENDMYKLGMSYDDSKLNFDFSTGIVAIKGEISKDSTTKEELINAGAIVLNEKTQEEIMNEFSNIGNKLSEVFEK